MFFDELSNAFFRFSLRRLGAELDRGGGGGGGGGGLSPPPPSPPADHGSFGAQAQRGLNTHIS